MCQLEPIKKGDDYNKFIKFSLHTFVINKFSLLNTKVDISMI